MVGGTLLRFNVTTPMGFYKNVSLFDWIFTFSSFHLMLKVECCPVAKKDYHHPLVDDFICCLMASNGVNIRLIAATFPGMLIP